jgi:tetratricopeptide (TPR) repeat protein
MARAGLVYGLMRAGSREEAMAAAKDLIIAADTIPNPWAHSYALLTYGIAWCDADPLGARDALQRGLVMAQESGNRYNESHLANILGRLEAKHGDEAAALQYLARAIRNYHDSGNTFVIRVPLTSSPLFSNGSDAKNRPPQSPGSRSATSAGLGSLS